MIWPPECSATFTPRASIFYQPAENFSIPAPQYGRGMYLHNRLYPTSLEISQILETHHPSWVGFFAHGWEEPRIRGTTSGFTFRAPGGGAPADAVCRF